MCETKDRICEIEGCGREAVATTNGIEVCDRCAGNYTSVGLGAVRFSGRWHGVRGAVYTAEQAELFPGLATAEARRA